MVNLLYRKLNKVIEWGIYLLVFLLPIQARWIIIPGELNGGYWEYGTISLYATDILLILLLVLFVIIKFKKTNSVSEKKEGDQTLDRLHFFQIIFKFGLAWLLIAGLDLVIFISIFFAPDKLTALFSYSRFLLGISLFLLVTKVSFKSISLLYSFMAGIIFQAVLGIWQFLSQSSFACKWLGMAAHKPEILGTSVVETMSGARWLRAYGGLDHPNILGGLLVIGLLLVVGLIITHDTSRGRKLNIRNRGHEDKGKGDRVKKKIGLVDMYRKFLTTNLFLCAVFCLLAIALFFTFSRGAWAGLIVGLILMFVILVIKQSHTGQKKLLVIISGLFILVLVFYNLYGDLVLARLSKDTRLETRSLNERVLANASAVEIIKDRWLVGVGVGNYTNYLSHKGGENKPSYSYHPVHNVYLLIISEIGVLGFFIFIGLLVCIISKLIKIKDIYFGGGVELAIIGAILTIFMVDHWWWSMHFGVLLFWLIAALLYKKATTN